MAGVKAIPKRLRKAIHGARTQYQGLGHFQQLRAMFAGLFVLDIVITGLFIIVLNSQVSTIDVTYKAEFPTRLLVVRNRDEAFADAKVILDNRYVFQVPRLERGSIGIDLRDFRDDKGYPPDATYRPNIALIVATGRRFEIPVGGDHPKP